MARTVAGRRLTEAQRQEQLQVRSGFLLELLALWPLLDFTRLDDTSPAWLRVAMDAVRKWRQESANVADVYYDRYRQVEVPHASTPVPSVEFTNAPEVRGHRAPDRSAVVNFPGRTDSGPNQLVNVRLGEMVPVRLDWGNADRNAQNSLQATGPAYIKHLTKAGEGEQKAKAKALVAVSGAASRHVLDGGRTTLLGKVAEDKVALGYVRVTDSNPCAFCAMLASRGPVFRKNSFDMSDPRFIGFGDAKVHDHCACTIEPVYSSSAPLPGDAQLYQQLWQDNIAGKFGGKAALAEWRRLIRRRGGEQQAPAAIA